MINIKNTLTRFGSRTKFVVGKHSPEICMVGGIVMFGITVWQACKATMKAEEVLDKYAEAKARIAESKAAADDPELKENGENIEYTEENIAHDRLVAFRDLVFGLIKKYWPVALCGALSVGLFFSTYKITHARLTTAIGAYTALDGAYKRYRERVRDEIGVDREREVFTGVKKENAFVKEVNDVGDEVVEEKEVDRFRGDLEDETGFVLFSEYTSNQFRKGDPIYNEAFLHGVENQFNWLLHSRGYVFEREVREALGLKITDSSTIKGWILDPANLPNAATHPINFHIQQLFRETGETVLASGRIVNDVSGKEWGLTFETDVIWNLIHIWENRRSA